MLRLGADVYLLTFVHHQLLSSRQVADDIGYVITNVLGRDFRMSYRITTPYCLYC